MAVLWFHGWDLEQNLETGIAPQGLRDWQGFPSWTGGTNANMDFTTGYNVGQAAMPISSATGRIETSQNIGSAQIRRLSWWGRLDPSSTGTSNSNPEMLSFEVNHPTHGIKRLGIRRVSGGGSVELAGFTGSSDMTGSSFGTGTSVYTGTWAFYELFIDALNNSITLSRNGSVDITGSHDYIAGGSATLRNVGFRAPGSTVNQIRFAYDHMVLTSSESLIGNADDEILGVAVHYGATSKDTASGRRQRGRIIVNGTDYFGTARQTTVGGSNDGTAPESVNYFSDYWMTNPDTAAAWGTDISVIDGWGVCRTDNTGGVIIFPNMALTYLVMVSGFPEVHFDAPGDLFVLDGTWDRTDPASTWQSHVDNYPRTIPNADSGWEHTDPFDSANTSHFIEDYIGVYDPGCIAFFQPTVVDPEDPTPISGIGLTFAEEFRTSYRDWESVVAGGDDFCSYFITGYKVHGEGNKKFQSNYVTINYQTDANGSAYVQGVWDYALANTPDDAHSRSDTGRWSSTQQIYGPTNDVAYKHAFRKLKVRGHGKALQFKVKCESGKPFYINGWVVYVTGNTVT